MKMLTMLLLFASCLTADTLQIPVLSPDSQALDPSSPGLGQMVYAIPGSQWLVGFNDNRYNTAPGVNGDFDFNDAWATVAFTLPGMATLEYVASDSADTNLVRFSGLGMSWLSTGESESLFLPLGGQVVPIEMYDASLENLFHAGPAAGNFDNTVHSWVGRTDTPATVPEPGTLALLGSALVLIGIMRRKVHP